MPYIGQQVTPAQQVNAVRDISRQLTHAATVARAFSNTTLAQNAERPFTLAPVSPHLIGKWVKQGNERLIWANEFNCWNRSADRAHALIGLTGIGTRPVDNTFPAAIAHYRHATVVSADFHAAVAFKIEGRPGIWALDLLEPRKEPIPLEEWSYGNPVTLRRPWAGTGEGSRARYVNEIGFEAASASLRQSWANPAQHGVELLS
jgi:hypothetical protein